MLNLVAHGRYKVVRVTRDGENERKVTCNDGGFLSLS